MKSLAVTLTSAQAQKLYDWFESDEAPPYWENDALAALHAAVSEWHRNESAVS